MTEEYSRRDDKRAPSLARNQPQSTSTLTKGFGVKPSPFNPVKRELGFWLLFAVLLVLVVHRLADESLSQLVILLGFSLVAMLRLVYRARQVVQQQRIKEE